MQDNHWSRIAASIGIRRVHHRHAARVLALEVDRRPAEPAGHELGESLAHEPQVRRVHRPQRPTAGSVCIRS